MIWSVPSSVSAAALPLVELSVAVRRELDADGGGSGRERVQAGALPEKVENDALHTAKAAIHHIPYLLTWNCRHMANATIRSQIETVCAGKGYKAPAICTPEELMEAKP